MAWEFLLPLLTVLVASEGRLIKRADHGHRAAMFGRVASDRSATSAASRAEWAALAQVESDDRRFWSNLWDSIEVELVELQGAAAEAAASLSASKAARASALLLSVPAPPVPSSNQSQKATSASSPPAARAATKAAAKVEATSATRAKRAGPTVKHAAGNSVAGLVDNAKLNLNPKTPTDLVPALAMLKGLYEDGKSRIMELNAREKQSKQRFEEKEAQHKSRLARIEARFKNNTLSVDFRTNETRDENRLWTYWQRVRERQHRQFHTSLKIQHATLEKVKSMIGMYEKTISGKADKAQVKMQLAKVSGGIAPEIVLMQDTQQAAAHFCREALQEVRAARAELRGTGPAPPEP